MCRSYTQERALVFLFILAFFLTQSLLDDKSTANDLPPDPLLPSPPIYWCPGKTQDQLISVEPKAGCQALYDTQADEAFRASVRRQGYDLPEHPALKIVEIQSAASRFSDRYRNFLSCCVMSDEDPGKILDLIAEANNILKSVQHNGVYHSAGFGRRSNPGRPPGAAPGTGEDNGELYGGRGEAPILGTFARQYTLSAIVGMVARAREDLLSLWQRLDKLKEAQQSLNGPDYEADGRTGLNFQQEEEAIRRDFQGKKPPASAPTGLDIQDTTLRSRIGGDIAETTLNANFGADIGASFSPYGTFNESLHPRGGAAIQDSNLPYRLGIDLQDTTIPYSSGFEIDSTQNREGGSTIQRRGVGPSIGDSELNRPR